MDGATTRIVLDLDPSIEPVGGRLSIDGAPPLYFAGWMQLAEAVTTALGRHTPPSPSPDGEPMREEVIPW